MFEEKVVLHSYKHDKTLHRVWKTETIIDENEEYIIIANKRTKVVESNGRVWYTKEPSVAILFKKHWYNVIGIIKKTGVSFYCNLSSPILRDKEALKYIDYDLDIKIKKNMNYNIVDKFEFDRNKESMKYPEDIIKILNLELEDLIRRIDNRDFPFNKNTILDLYNKYKRIDSE